MCWQFYFRHFENTSKINTDFLKTQAYEYVLSRKEIEKSECGFIASFL